MKPSEQLDDLITKGVELDIFRAEQALSLSWFIGTNASQLNDAGFGTFFGALREILGRYIFIAVSRMFEPISKKYPTRSIPVILKLLREQTDALPIKNHQIIRKKLAAFGHAVRTLTKLSSAETTRLLVQEYSVRFPQSDDPHANQLSKAWCAVKLVRDKAVAHAEVVTLSDDERATFSQIDSLLCYAKSLAGAVGVGYLNITLEFDNGEYSLTSDAKKATRSLERLLKHAGILTSN